MTIKIENENGKVCLTSPFHPELPAQARNIGGRWAGGRWVFDARDEQRVRDLAREVYGTDGTATATVTVRVAMDSVARLLRSQRGPETLFLFGRQIAVRRSRDTAVQLGDGVIVVDGGFPTSGGSMKNPCLSAKDGTVLEIRDVPAGHADLSEYKIEIVDEAAPAVNVDALPAERDALLARLAEIDALLPEPEGAEMSTREAAAALGVSVRTVQRWAAQGKVEAAKNPAGRWVITITINA